MISSSTLSVILLSKDWLVWYSLPMAEKEKIDPLEIPEEEMRTEDLIGNPQEAFDIDQDLETLRKIDISKAILIKTQRGGKHPDKKTDRLLDRYMQLGNEEIEGPYLIRVLSTIMFVFIVSALSWLLIWLLGAVAGWSVFLRFLSIAMSTFVIAMFGVAVFNPMSLVNEPELQRKIKLRLEELHQSRQKDINEKLGADAPPSSAEDSITGDGLKEPDTDVPLNDEEELGETTEIDEDSGPSLDPENIDEEKVEA